VLQIDDQRLTDLILFGIRRRHVYGAVAHTLIAPVNYRLRQLRVDVSPFLTYSHLLQ